ncbi:plasmid recombination protein [Paracoccus xiamenensis]|uniref:plasmid recombination protein n=1 Tax=Paracoccus xiamenensis TaxID=2714901 RepID=UPI00140AF4CA|nr:plasmid recombination protein [Paracoccus xiamenensis]NHF71536.1 hypothetical protein [Paracoccus xiamenensis]
MTDVPAASGKSIFAHKQTYSQKGNSKSRSVRSIIEELERLEGACSHVPNPQPPGILEGIQPHDLIGMIDSRVTEQNRALRKMRTESPDQKAELRGIRVDTHLLMASVFSYPDTVEDMDEEEYRAWRDDVIAFARRDAAANDLEIMTIVEHRDESHPHLHVLALPLISETNPRMNAKLCHEGHVAQDHHIRNGWSGSPSRSYRRAMSAWQDRYYAEVGSKHGQARTGPKRRRLDRATWKAEQIRIALQKGAEKAERSAAAANDRAEQAEVREQAAAKRTAEQRLQDAAIGQRLAEEGLISALAATEANERLLARVTRRIDPRGYPARNADENAELHARVDPMIRQGLEALSGTSPNVSLSEQFRDIFAMVIDWTQRLAEAIPRWLKWDELVDRITRSAQIAFGWSSRPSTLAGVIEATPAWRDIEDTARRDLDRARGVAALVAKDSQPDNPRHNAVFRFTSE